MSLVSDNVPFFFPPLPHIKSDIQILADIIGSLCQLSGIFSSMYLKCSLSKSLLIYYRRDIYNSAGVL